MRYDGRKLSPRSLAGGMVILALAIGLVVLVDHQTRPEPPMADASPVSAVSAPEVSPVVSAADATIAAPADAALPEGTSVGELAPRQNVSQALATFGVTTGQVHALVVALDGLFDFRDAKPGARLTVAKDSAGRLILFRYEQGPLRRFEVTREADGTLKGRRIELAVQTEPVGVGAVIQTSLYEALQASRESPALVGHIVDVFAWDVDFFNTQAGDEFKVIVEKIVSNGQLVRYGRVLAAQYQGRSKQVRAFFFDPDGEEQPEKGGYYLEDGQSVRKTYLASPLKYSRISSGFGMRRHPVLGYDKQHQGVDFAAPRGTPVWAMADGEVTFAGRKGANGNLVVIQHRDGVTTLYAHLDKIQKGIKAGIKVEQKQIIGTVGSTGRSTGPHLHLGARKGGRYIDPRTLDKTRGAPVAARYRKAFDELVAKLLPRLEAITLAKAP